MTHFPTDIVADILSRLPVEPVLRLRCVSKPWCALIDSPHFVKLHLKRSTQTRTNQQLILSNGEIYSVNLHSLDVAVKINHHPFSGEYVSGLPHRHEVVGSCDGLLLIRRKFDQRTIQVCVWNPSTRIHHILPPIIDIQTPDNCCCIGNYYGIGFDSVHDDYKVLNFIRFYGDKADTIRSQVQVYSLKTNSWRMIVTDFPYYLSWESLHGMFASGALHLVVTETDDHGGDSFIVAFDLANEEYQIVPIPPSLGHEESGHFHMELTSLEGYLCIVSKYEDDPCNVWIMKDYGVKESWTLLLSLPPYGYTEPYCFVIPVAFLKDGTEVLLLRDNTELIRYDLKLKVFQKVNIRGVPVKYYAGFSAQSLVPLNLEGLGGNSTER